MSSDDDFFVSKEEMRRAFLPDDQAQQTVPTSDGMQEPFPTFDGMEEVIVASEETQETVLPTSDGMEEIVFASDEVQEVVHTSDAMQQALIDAETMTDDLPGLVSQGTQTEECPVCCSDISLLCRCFGRWDYGTGEVMRPRTGLDFPHSSRVLEQPFKR